MPNSISSRIRERALAEGFDLVRFADARAALGEILTRRTPGPSTGMSSDSGSTGASLSSCASMTTRSPVSASPACAGASAAREREDVERLARSLRAESLRHNRGGQLNKLMIRVEGADRHWQVRRRLPLNCRARFADGKASAALKGKQTNDADEQNDSWNSKLPRPTPGDFDVDYHDIAGISLDRVAIR